MKQLLGTAVLLLLTSLPAYAQASLGSSLNSGGGHHLPSYPVLSNSVTYSTGPSEFTPSTFMNYDQAVAVGRIAAAEHAKTLGEVAKNSRESAKSKAQIVVEQDAENRVVVSKTP
jgi:hypothetical protein